MRKNQRKEKAREEAKLRFDLYVMLVDCAHNVLFQYSFDYSRKDVILRDRVTMRSQSADILIFFK